MGKKGHLTLDKRALNIRRRVHLHPTHTPFIEGNTLLSLLKYNGMSSQDFFKGKIFSGKYLAQKIVKLP